MMQSDKQAEFRELPKDWTVSSISSVCKLINGRGFKPSEWKASGLPIIRIQNLNGSDIFNYFQGPYDPKIEVKDGQILFAWSGSRGTSFGPHIWHGETGLLNYHTWKVATCNEHIDRGFFFHALKKLTTFIESKAHGASALVHTQKWEMEGYQFPHPSNQKEQEAIAEALSDVDELIAGLEALITKKRALKTATMQELLTGKTRLSGFTGKKGWKRTELGLYPADWKIRAIGDVVAEISMGPFGSDIKVSNFVPDGVPVLSGDNIRTHKLVDGFRNFVTIEKAKSLKKAVARRGDIVVTHRGTIGQVAYIPNNSAYDQYVISQSQFRANFIEGVCPNWVALYFLSDKGSSELLEGKGHTGVPAIAQATTTFRKLLIPLPRVEEQQAILDLLADFDTSIDASVEQLNKTKSLKQGMMQELLTGRTRLI